MKKILTVGMVFLLLTGLCGCGARDMSQEEIQQIVKQCETVIEKYVDKNGYKIIDRDNDSMEEDEESDFLLQINDDWFISVCVSSDEQVYVEVNLENAAYVSGWDDYWGDDDYWDDDDWDDDDWDGGDNVRVEEGQRGDSPQRLMPAPVPQMVTDVLQLYNALGRKKHVAGKIIDFVHRFDKESEVDSTVSFPLSDWSYGFFRYSEGNAAAVCLSLYDKVELPD